MNIHIPYECASKLAMYDGFVPCG